MIVPVAAPALFARLTTSLNRAVLPAVVLWSALSGLAWLPGDIVASAAAGGACQTLAIAQLFGGLLLLSACTRRTGALWTAGVFTASGLLAIATANGCLAVAALAIAAWSGATYLHDPPFRA